MKKIMQVLLLGSLFFSISCSDEGNSNLDYRVGSNGLIYEKGSSEKLYTGRIIDTTNVIIEMDIVAGKRHGEFITYYLNGNIEKQGYIENNINEGKWSYYYKDGTLESSGNFKNDKAHGEWVFYYPNGNKKESGKFIEGKRAGNWILYNEKGEVIQELDSESKVLPQKPETNS